MQAAGSTPAVSALQIGWLIYLMLIWHYTERSLGSAHYAGLQANLLVTQALCGLVQLAKTADRLPVALRGTNALLADSAATSATTQGCH